MNTNEEWAGINRQPNVPSIIDGFEYPKAVKALVKKVESAWGEWAEADTAVSVAEFDLEQAKKLDARLFAESVLSGTDDPGEVHTPVAERKLKGAQILADARRRETNALGRSLESLMRENAREITLTAIRDARIGIAEQQRLMNIASLTAIEAIEARNKGLEGLRQISHYTRGVYSFDASFPNTGNLTLPSVREERVTKIVDDLENLILAGQLFGESTEADSAE